MEEIVAVFERKKPNYRTILWEKHRERVSGEPAIETQTKPRAVEMQSA
jgi:hypothetical protein